MGKHTPEPWRVAAKALVRLDSAYLIEAVEHHDFKYGATLAATSQHDARRIVACVNACAGLSTEQLEASPLGGVLNGVAGLIAQRDQLLEALEMVIADKAPGYHDCIDDGEQECAWCVARSAIAKAKGGAV